MKAIRSLVFFVFLLIGCGSAKKEEKSATEPVIEVVKKQKKEEVDPEKAKFIKTYNELSCRANYDYDPESTFGAVKEPVTYLKKLKENESSLLEGYLTIIKKNGYKGLKDFFDAAFRFQKDEKFWNDFEAGLIDRLKDCHKK